MPVTEETTVYEVITVDDVRMLARANGTCITVALPIPAPLEASTRFKNVLRSLERKLEPLGAGIPQLMRPIQDLSATMQFEKVWARSFLIYRSAELFRCYLSPQPVTETSTVEGRFQIRHLLRALTTEQRFHLLALSRHNTRLFRCTNQTAEEEDFGGLAPRDLRAWMGTWRPDHVLNNRASAGPSMGAAKGVPFTTSRDREREDQYVAHFFAEIDRGIAALLRPDKTPLVLAGVEEEVTLYRRVNSYNRLLDKAVHGSPDAIDDNTLLERAREAVRQEPSEALAKSLARFMRCRDSASVTSDTGRILVAAARGRVSDLLFGEKAELRGTFHPDTGQMESRDDGEDLLNTAAAQTILHGGHAFELRESEMPLTAETIAVFRF